METGAHGVATDHVAENVELELNIDQDLAKTLHQNTVVLRAQDHPHKAETATLILVSYVLKKNINAPVYGKVKETSRNIEVASDFSSRTNLR